MTINERDFSWLVIGITGTALLLAIIFGGCGERGGIPASSATPRASFPLGYSLPNAWHRIDPVPFAVALEGAGLTITEIEYAPFHGAPQVCKGTTNETYPQSAANFVSAMCAHNVEVLINIVNGNACAQTNQDDRWFQSKVDEILAFADPACVILSAVSEPFTADKVKLHRWTKIARSQWSGRFVIPAEPGVKPHYTDVLFDYLDGHACSQAKLDVMINLSQPTLLANTDCSPMLNPGPAKASAWAARAIAHHAPLLVYDFHALAPDFATIAAMGEQIP